MLALDSGWRMKMIAIMRMGWLVNGDRQKVHLCLLRELQRITQRQTHTKGHISCQCSVDWAMGIHGTTEHSLLRDQTEKRRETRREIQDGATFCKKRGNTLSKK